MPEGAVQKSGGKELTQSFHGVNEQLGRLHPVAVDHVGMGQDSCLLEGGAGRHDAVQVGTLVDRIQTGTAGNLDSPRHRPQAAVGKEVCQVAGKDLFVPDVAPKHQGPLPPQVLQGKIPQCTGRCRLVNQMNACRPLAVGLTIEAFVEGRYICLLVAAHIVQAGVAEGALVPVAAVGEIGLEPGSVGPQAVHGIGAVRQPWVAAQINVGKVWHQAGGKVLLHTANHPPFLLLPVAGIRRHKVLPSIASLFTTSE